MKLIGLLLLGLVSLVEGEVVASFAVTCPGFFIKDQNIRPIPPTVVGSASRYQQICQRYGNQYRYATLYDTQNRIPVYSAYIYSGYAPTGPHTWLIEPQLDGVNLPEMTTDGNILMLPHQAVNQDYAKSGYNRGHLYPKCHNCKQDQTESTYTLTNAAPQTGEDNRRWFNQVERIVDQSIKTVCSANTAHVVTGVIPGNISMNRRVNIPSYYWTAFCCRNRNSQNQFISEGYRLQMTGGGTATATTYSLTGLNAALTGMYGLQFQVFGTIPGCS